MNLNEIKPLQPLPHGNILIVGAKPSNFDEEIMTHPRVILWSSQQEHWTDKDLPTNVQAVFITRWIGHAAFAKIHAEARKKHITLFNPAGGTGMIARQVKELLDLNKPAPEPEPEPEPTPEEPMAQKKPTYNKLVPLHDFIDLNKGNLENARLLMPKAKELGITTTLGSLSQLVSQLRRKERKMTGKVVKAPTKRKGVPIDIVVEMLDGVVIQLKDMRDFLIATVEENRDLKSRMDQFEKLFRGVK